MLHLLEIFLKTEDGLNRMARKWAYHLLPIVLVAVAAVLRIFIPILHETPYVTFFPAIIVSALYGGLWSGLFATALSAMAASTFFGPGGSVQFDIPGHFAGISVFLVGNIINVAICSRLRAEINERKRAEEALQKAHDELGIRVKERTADLANINEELEEEIAVRKVAQESLVDQSKILESFFKHTQTCLVFLDKKFNFIRVNDAYAKACGRDVSDFLGHNHFVDYPSDELRGKFQDVVDTKKPYAVFGRPFVFPDHPEWGVTYWDLTVIPILTKKGELDFLVFSLRDVTERKTSEEKIGRLNRLYSVLSKVNEAIVRINEPKILYEQVCRIAVEDGSFKMAWIGITDPETKAVNPVVSYGDDGAYLKGITIYASDVPEGRGPTGRAAFEGVHSICGDIEHDPRMLPWRDRALKHGFRSSAAFPIRAGSAVIGALTIYSHMPEFFTDEEIGLLSSLVEDISFAIDTMTNEKRRVEVEEHIRTHNTLLELFSHSFSRNEYLDEVVKLVSKWSGCRCVGIRVLEKNGNIPYEAYTGFSAEFWELENWLSIDRDQCACIRVITENPEPQDLPVMTSGGSFYINNSLEFVSGLTEEQQGRFRGTCVRNGFRSVAVVPVRYAKKVLGAIHLADEREGMVLLKTVELIELIAPLIGEAAYRFSIEAELRRNYEALQRSEKSLSEAQRIAGLGNWDWDLRTNDLRWAEGIYRIFGVTPQPHGTTYVAFLNYVHPDDREFVKNAINQALHDKKPYNIEHRIVLPDSTTRIVHQQGEIIFDDSGEPIRMVGTFQDITERKRSEEELAYSREQLRNLSMHLQSMREKERTNIAREIHDELGQALTALKMDVAWLGNKYKDEEAHAEKTRSMLKLIDMTIKSVKRIAAELRPGLLDDLGLAAAIEWQAAEFEKRAGISCDVTISPKDLVIDRERSTAVFRIFQEAMTNVARHAKATRVKIHLEERPDRIVLRVEDDGKGITKKQIQNPRAFGLIGIRERVHFLSGEVSIHGVPNKGTTVMIEIPLEIKPVE